MRRFSLFLQLTVLLGGLLATEPVRAEYTSRLDSVQQIEEVVVTGNRLNEIVPTQKLDGKVLEKLNSFSVADAIRYFSGVQIKDYGGIGGLKTVNVRSMGTNHMGVFYDGIQLGNAQNGQIDLGKFSLDNMEEISLYNGQKSDIFQSAKDFGSSGSIYLRAKRPRFKEGETYHVQATMKAGSFGLANPSVLWEQKLSDAVALSVNAEYIYATGKYKFRYRKMMEQDGKRVPAYDTTAVRQNGDVQAVRAEVGAHGVLDRGMWNARAYYYDSERGIPGAIVNNVFRRGERQWDRNLFVQGAYMQEVTSYYKVQANAKYAYDYTHYLSDDEKLKYIDNRFHQQEVYLSAANLFTLYRWWDVSLSGDFQWNTLHADLTDFTVPSRYTGLLSLATALHWAQFKMQASVLGTFLHESVSGRKSGVASPDRQVFTPAVFLSYKPFRAHELNVRAFYKRIFRLPTFNDLYYTDMGNANLKPEFTTQYDAGVVYEKAFSHSFFKYLNVQGDFYYNEVSNKIIAYPTGKQFRWTMLNLGRVEILGVDVAAQLSGKWKAFGADLRVNYTWQQARDVTDRNDMYYKHQIPYIPWHSGSAIVALSWKDWSFNYSFIYTGERYSQQMNEPINYVEPWYTSDVALSWSFRAWKTRIRLTAEVNNLFNQAYDVVENYPMPGTNFKFIIRVNI